jgi:hypothetical protein
MKTAFAATLACLILAAMGLAAHMTWATDKGQTRELKLGCGTNAAKQVETKVSCAHGPEKDGQPIDLISGLEGSVPDPEGKIVKIDLHITSKVIIEKGKTVKLIYVIHVGSSDATPLAVSKDDNPKKYPILVWESAESETYTKYLKDKKVSTIDAQNDVIVSLRAEEFEVTRRLLKVMVGDTVIISTTAPAYTPKKRKE